MGNDLTKGEVYALTILTAKELGLDASYEKQAEDFLRNKKIAPILIRGFEEEATRCGKEAFRKYGLNKCLEKMDTLKEKFNLVH
ncbi:hypothetical protein D1Z98_01885 [Riemerella anatipestifer]|uniref:hypothetical protein n=1 Tax=Riemerella anatipestifer TaxID=34085 RepID=UPI00129E284F|nr:hypothetical protein [Riemerella anatipestifer]MRM93760.1 hypothetical protein [Riemerella anatipestifer]